MKSANANRFSHREDWQVGAYLEVRRLKYRVRLSGEGNTGRLASI